jgi:hypothetical protein
LAWQTEKIEKKYKTPSPEFPKNRKKKKKQVIHTGYLKNTFFFFEKKNPDNKTTKEVKK